MKKRTSLATQVYESLKSDILHHRFSGEGCLPSEFQLCDHFKVSRKTVRTALVRLREEGLIRSHHGLGWLVRRTTRKKRRVCVLFHDCREFNADLPNMILAKLAERNTSAVCHFLQKSLISLRTLIDLDKFGGIISVGNHPICEPILAEIRECAFHQIGLNYYSQEKYDTFAMDPVTAMEMLVKDLVQKGYKTFVYVDESDNTDSSLPAKLDTFKKVTTELKLASTTITLDKDINNMSEKEARKLASAIDAKKKTAVIGSDNDLAAGLIISLSSQGIAIPKDAGVAGIGDADVTRSIAPLRLKKLSGVGSPVDELAELAAMRMQQRLAGDTSPSMLHIRTPVLLAGDTVK